MFNDKYGLTQAVLDGRKIMTRRLEMDCNLRFYLNEHENSRIVIENDRTCIYSNEEELLAVRLNRYKIDEVVAIAQSYKDMGYDPDSLDRDPKDLGIRGFMKHNAGWNNKMFVLAAACKHHIRITNVQIERLQDISDEDCLKEGIEEHLKGVQYGFSSNIGYIGQYPFSNPREAFAALIDRISGKGIWESNPYVWAYEFELIN